MEKEWAFCCRCQELHLAPDSNSDAELRTLCEIAKEDWEFHLNKLAVSLNGDQAIHLKAMIKAFEMLSVI